MLALTQSIIMCDKLTMNAVTHNVKTAHRLRAAGEICWQPGIYTWMLTSWLSHMTIMRCV